MTPYEQNPSYVSCTPVKSSNSFEKPRLTGLSGTYPKSLNSYFSQFEMVGRGIHGEGCGRQIEYVCPNCGEEHLGETTCKKRTCPSCGFKWARKYAITARARLWDGHRCLYRKKEIRNRIIHVSISWKQKVLDDMGCDRNDFKAKRQAAINIAKDAGIFGGIIIFHPMRVNVYDGEYDVEGEHFHVVGLSSWVKSGVDIYDKYDAVFKVLKRKVSQINLFKTLYYDLEHCAVSDTVHGLSWFGELSYNKGLVTDGEEILVHESQQDKGVPCPTCGHKLELKVRFDRDEGDWVYFGDG